MLLVVIGWVIFANDDFAVLGRYLENLVSSKSGTADGYTLFLITSNLVLWILAVVFSTSLPRILGEKFQKLCNRVKPLQILEIIAITALLIISLALMVGGGYNPFLYFRF